MKTSRRQAIKTAAAAGAALVAELGWLASASEAAAAHSGRAPLADVLKAHSDAPWPTRGMLEARIGDVFRIARDGMGPVDLHLARVIDVPCAHVAGLVGHQGCFVAVFDGPAASPIAQDSYRAENRAMGAFDLFVVPGTAGDGRVAYAATFNRLA